MHPYAYAHAPAITGESDGITRERIVPGESVTASREREATMASGEDDETTMASILLKWDAVTQTMMVSGERV